jgi:hypothetical protein
VEISIIHGSHDFQSEILKAEVKVSFFDFWDDLNDLNKNPFTNFIDNNLKIIISIKLHNSKNICDAIDYIIQIHQHPESYLHYFKELRFKPSIYSYEDELRIFLNKVFSQTPIDARRRSESYYVINKNIMFRRLRIIYRFKNKLSKLAVIRNSYYFIQKIFYKSSNKRI